jgi:Tfp pilus assembly protein PilF
MKIFRAHRLRLTRCIALSLALFLLPMFAPVVFARQVAELTTLYGTVQDPEDKPVAGATIELKSESTGQILTTRTDSEGSYGFRNLPQGVYDLRAQMAGFREAAISALSLVSGQKKMENIELVLIPARSQGTQPASTQKASNGTPSAQTPQFFDPPQFTISGVTDTTGLGGHGSDVVVKTGQSLAKETVMLDHGDRVNPGTGTTGRLSREDAERERDHVQALLAQHEDQADLHHRLADVEEKLGDNLAAVREYQRAAELEPSEANVFDWGAELLLHHAAEPAGEVFAKGAHLFPNSTRMFIGLGAAWFARGSIGQAVEEICRASDLKPNDPTPYLFLGRVESAEIAPSAKAVESFRRFRSLQPHNAAANYYYAVALWKVSRGSADTAQIESLLRQAIEADPKFGAAYLQLGIVHSEQGDDRRAIPEYQRAIQTGAQRNDAEITNSEIEDSEIEDAHYRLAQAFRRTGDREKAKAELDLYEKMVRESTERTDRERHEIRQFVYTLRDQAPAPMQ